MRLTSPFAQFQAIEANLDGTRRLIHSIREFCQSPESHAVANHRFDAFWPQLCKHLDASQKSLSSASTLPVVFPTDYQFAVSRLETQVSSLTDMIRDLVQNWNPNPSPNLPPNTPAKRSSLSLEQLIGVWRNSDTGSHGYARLINGSLYMPYCYGGNDSLTAHYTDWSLVGDHVFARFEWLTARTQGFSLYKLTDDDVLSGQWWPGADSEKPTPTEIEAIAQCGLHRQGTVSEWVRISTRSVPSWVEKYFSRLDHYQKINRIRGKWHPEDEQQPDEN